LNIPAGWSPIGRQDLNTPVGMRAIQIANLILVIWFTLTAARLLFGK
jgi:hypothetical protein